MAHNNTGNYPIQIDFPHKNILYYIKLYRGIDSLEIWDLISL